MILTTMAILNSCSPAWTTGFTCLIYRLKPLNRPWFYHRQLVAGGTLVLELGPVPNKRWGSRPEDAPPSMKTAGQ